VVCPAGVVAKVEGGGLAEQQPGLHGVLAGVLGGFGYVWQQRVCGG
jgi:hypothetical protein